MASHDKISAGDGIEIEVKDGVLSLEVSVNRLKLSAATQLCWRCIPDCTKIDTTWSAEYFECCATVEGGKFSGLESSCIAPNKTTQIRGCLV